MRFCLLLGLVMSCLVRSEDTPFSSLDAAVSVSALVSMRADLAGASAADPRLATAEMAFVDLALNGDPRDRGGHGGVWRQRAHELRDLRHTAGVKPASFEDAIPDLWVEALDGRMAQCVAGLDAWPEAKDAPHGRALRCLCTRDWRPIKQLPHPTAHERLALAIAYWQCGMGQPLERLRHDDLPPFAYDTLVVATVGFSHEATAGVLRSAEQNCWMLAASPALPPTAVPAADAFLAHLGLAGADERRQRAAQVPRALANASTEDGETLLDAWRLADRATSGAAGLRSGDAWLLGGIGDWAAAARMDLFLGSWHRHDFVRASWGVPEDADRLSGLVAKADEGLFSAWHRWMGSRWQDVAAARAVLAGVDLELGRPAGGIPPMRLVSCASEVWQRVGDLREEAVACVHRIVAAQRAAEHGASAGWAEIGHECERLHDLGEVTDDIVAAAKADPWSIELARLSAICGVGSIPVWMTWQTLGARLAGRADLVPSAERLRAFRGQTVDHTLMGCPEAALAYFAGDVDRAGALGMPNSDADEMRYYLAIDAASRHDVAAAKADLTAATASHPKWAEFGGAKRFRAWLDAGANQRVEEPTKPDF